MVPMITATQWQQLTTRVEALEALLKSQLEAASKPKVEPPPEPVRRR